MSDTPEPLASGSPSEKFLPSASIDTLRRRAKILAQIRSFFDDRGFFEVHTPVLSRDTVVDRFIEPFPVEVQQGSKQHQRYWLQTSPEFGMKRLLAAGAEAIYQIGPVFRAGETGQQHNLEFTMLEWYRVGDNYQQGMDLLDEFAQSILSCPPATRVSYREIFQQHANLDPFRLDDDERYRDLRLGFNRDDDLFLNYCLTEFVEPKLASQASTIIYDWPAKQAALAQVRSDANGDVAERFELYVGSVELANGYHELTEPQEMTRRFRRINRQRLADGGKALPEDSRLLDAMRSGLPPCCGVALGIDRLTMLVTGLPTIADVLPFDSQRA